MKRKILALLLAVFLSLCISAPCFADALNEENNNVSTETVLTDIEQVVEEDSEAAKKSETSSRLPAPKITTSSEKKEVKETMSSKFEGFVSTLKKNFNNTFIKEKRWKLFVEGFGNTVLIALCSTLLGVLIGMIVALVKVFRNQIDHPNIIIKFLSFLCNIYTSLIRGTPAVVQLFIAYYIIFKSTDNYILVSIFAFGVNSGAYVSEIIRGGIAAVDRGQLEAGRSLGLSHLTTMFFIVLPQAIKNILPALGNEFILLLKDTSIAGYIGTLELMKAGNIVRSRTFEPYFSLLSVAAVYLVCVIGMEQLLKAVERRLAKSDRH